MFFRIKATSEREGGNKERKTSHMFKYGVTEVAPESCRPRSLCLLLMLFATGSDKREREREREKKTIND